MLSGAERPVPDRATARSLRFASQPSQRSQGSYVGALGPTAPGACSQETVDFFTPQDQAVAVDTGVLPPSPSPVKKRARREFRESQMETLTAHMRSTGARVRCTGNGAAPEPA